MKRIGPLGATGLLALLSFLIPLAPESTTAVRQVDVTARGDLLGGKRFGTVGSYEKIIARVHFALDPANAHNRVIVDLDRAPRNKGRVELWADVVVLRPKERGRGNGALLVDVPNRGGPLSWRGTIANESEIDTWYLHQGYTLASIGWQFDVRDAPDRLRLAAPVAHGIAGRVRSDFVVIERSNEHTVAHVIQDSIGGAGYPVSAHAPLRRRIRARKDLRGHLYGVGSRRGGYRTGRGARFYGLLQA